MPTLKSLARRLRGQFRPLPPSRRPAGFDEAARRLLHARHCFAYRWVLPYVIGRRVLEIGPNLGYGLEILKPYVGSLTAVDNSLAMARASREAAQAPVVQGNGQVLPFSDGSFDVVVAFQVIEHVWDDLAFLREIRRVLVPGGRALLTTPQRRQRLLYGQIPWNEEHLREYGSLELERVCKCVFGKKVSVAGVFGDEVADPIERVRIHQDAWGHFVPGRVLAPLRFAGRRIQRALGDEISLSVQLSRLAEEDPRELLRHFYVAHHSKEEALDLAVRCERHGLEREPVDIPFDTASYWRERHERWQGLESTGTLGRAEAWQSWRYRAKRRAYVALLRRNGVDVRGMRVLDFGCCRGYFEGVWEELGAAHTAGVDIDAHLISALRSGHPRRTYLHGNLGVQLELLADQEPFDLVTLVDVSYHILDDAELARSIKKLAMSLRPGGWVLLADASRDARSAPNVRFRAFNHWLQLYASCGLRFVDREPVSVFHNRTGRWMSRFPRLMSLLQFVADAPARRLAPWGANNWAILARKVE